MDLVPKAIGLTFKHESIKQYQGNSSGWEVVSDLLGMKGLKANKRPMRK